MCPKNLDNEFQVLLCPVNSGNWRGTAPTHLIGAVATKRPFDTAFAYSY